MKVSLSEMLELARDDRQHLKGVLSHYREQELGDDPIRERQLQVRDGIVTVIEAMAKDPERSRRFIQDMMGR